MPRLLARAVLAAAGVVAVSAGDASAQSTFSVDPLIVKLNGQTNNVVLTVTNPMTKDISFEIKAFAWDQSPPNGEMALTPTTDVVIFPPLVTVKARTTQRVRVGTTLAPGAIEKPYRIMIEEMPSAAAPSGSQVNVRTRIGIPVFIEATNPALSGRIDSVSVNGRAVSIVLSNTGNTHAVVDNIIVRGMTGPDQLVFEDSLEGWYVLAGKKRTWVYTFKAAQCRQSKHVEVEVYAHDKVLTSRADVPDGTCRQ
jgi:fimbrial chaperone protein